MQVVGGGKHGKDGGLIRRYDITGVWDCEVSKVDHQCLLDPLDIPKDSLIVVRYIGALENRNGWESSGSRPIDLDKGVQFPDLRHPSYVLLKTSSERASVGD